MTPPPERDYRALLRSFDVFDQAHEGFTYGAAGSTRAHCPVVRTGAGTGFWMITRSEDVRRVLADWETFSPVGGSPAPIRLGSLDVDPPPGAALREVLDPLFSRSFALRFEAEARSYAAQLIDGWVGNGHVELLGEFAGPFVSRVLARMVFDEEDASRMARAEAVVTRVAEDPSDEAFFSLAELSAEYLAAAVARPPEREGFLRTLVTATIDGEPLAEEERLGALNVIFLGGLDATRWAIGMIAMHIGLQPEPEQRVRDPHWVRQDVDEFIRLESPVATFTRTATKDVEIGGALIRRGERVLVRFDSVNRDEAWFPDAGAFPFDPPRDGDAGLGVHRCLGAHLARAQIAIAFDELFTRITNPRLDLEPADPAQLTWAPGIATGPDRVPLLFDRVTGA